ncbi:MAG TPA: FAD-dependent thymidylate synthase [Dehalococcoidia bacterium]|nr:FAD-dependent thymidylate synthase [Dehalococcoidia bacterium]
MSEIGVVKVLDGGYVSLVETWGGDKSIIEAARMSTNKGFIGWGQEKCLDCGAVWDKLDCPVCTVCNSPNKKYENGDEKLLAYLYNNKHMTPFEMAGMIIEVKAPIFVFREWHRHRTQSYNEMSARYTPLPDENYIPTVERLMMQGGTNKQAQGTGAALTEEAAHRWITEYTLALRHAQIVYDEGIELGVPKELARLSVLVARYSRMRASANLRNWLAFLTLRQAPGAQWEIRQYANAVAELIEENFPRTYELFVKGESHG